MNRPKSPCVKECPRRTAECKLTCKDNLEYEAEYKKYEAEKQEINRLKTDQYKVSEHGKARIRRLKGK